MLLIFFGQIGAGKSSIAKRVAERLDYEIVHFDNIMWLAINKDKMYSIHGEFLLTLNETLKVYDAMHVIAKYLLRKGKNVVLESMYFKKQRGEAIKIAIDTKTPYKLIEVVCKEEIIKKRLEKRFSNDPQTPGFKLYLQYRDIFEIEESDHIIIDTSEKSIEECAQEVMNKIV